MFILALSRNKKRSILIAVDIILTFFSLWAAFALRLGQLFLPTTNQLWLFTITPILAIPIFIKFSLYRMVVRYMSHESTLTILKAAGAFVFIWSIVVVTLLPLSIGSEFGVPRSIPILFWIILILTLNGSRQFARALLIKNSKIEPKKNVLIFGASRLGSELASALSHDKSVRILGFIDDDPALHNHHVQGLKVLGDRTQIAKIRATISSLEVLLTMPNIPAQNRKELFRYLEDKKVTVKTIPSLRELTSESTVLDGLRNIEITDLLARKEVTSNKELFNIYLNGKNVLVTGAGGSIGSELCRQILNLKPACIILFEHSEFNLYKVNNELIDQCSKSNLNIKIIPLLGSITNKQRIEVAIKQFKVNIIYHAAAYKHVTLIESNVGEGIFNNIFGTYNVAQAALDLNVERFILISTDKAVRPTSVMGATKRIAEIIIQGLSQKYNDECIKKDHITRFAIVRFGNVLGSSGSVIPLFQKQIAAGGPITITHPEVTRYFMTIPEASQLVLQAGSMERGRNCCIFALNMGEPISILSLAKQLVYLSGHILKADENQMEQPGVDIQYTGLQKGEKLHEEVFLGENIVSTEHPMIMEAKEDLCKWSIVNEILNQLKPEQNLNTTKMRQLLLEFSNEDYRDSLS